MKIQTALVFLLCILTFGACASANKTTKDAGQSKKSFTPSFIVPEVTASYYVDAVKKLKTGGIGVIDSIDFVKLRYSYLLYAQDNNLTVQPDLDYELQAAMQSKNYRSARKLCDSILSIDFTNIRAHMLKAFALKSLGEDFSFNRKMMLKIENSILSSGDGKAPETAFHVSQIDEEYYVVSALSLSVNSQGLVLVGDHAFDVMECQNESGKSTSLYFDVTEHMAGISRRFGKEKKE